MNYKISSSNFEQPLLKPLLEEISEYFNSVRTRFYIIGATARDMIMDAHGEKSGRRTHDLDIAIAIPDWSKYQQIEIGLLKVENFIKDKNQKQRFIYKLVYQVDIVPFGDLMKENDKIFWPPDEQIAMSVLGFSEVGQATKKIIIDENLTIEVASLAGIFLLKIVAWVDRHLTGNKDADDMGFILTNYLLINENRAVEEYYEIYEDINFNITTAGAKLLGRDLAGILNKYSETKIKIHKMLQHEIDKQEESILINQIIETNRNLKYEEIFECFNNIIKELKD